MEAGSYREEQIMGRKLAIVLAAMASLALPAGVMAHGGGGGGGHGGGGGGHGGGGRGGFPGGGGPGVVSRDGHSVFVGPDGSSHALASHGAPGRVIGNGRYAWIGHHRFRGHHFEGFLAGIGWADYWYYGDCWVWTANGWIDLCGYGY
jgi:hypothetical protein